MAEEKINKLSIISNPKMPFLQYYDRRNRNWLMSFPVRIIVADEFHCRQ